MGIGWSFPGNGNGKIVGISEAGIETFRGNLFNSLAKEICQNSLDARLDSKAPVAVEFQLEEIEAAAINGFENLSRAIALCKEYWEENEKAANFFKNAVNICGRDKVRVLRVSDFNTTGLTGSKEYKSSPWQNLVKSSGVSDKNGTSGGSYGIGKSAPFACSDLRTVFYSTLDIEGTEAYQGVANLASFKYPDKIFKKGEVTQGTGYYGEDSNNSAVFSQLSLGGFKRSSPGTDLYILGFMDGEEWKDEVIKAVLDGYLISIFNEDIEIKIGDIEINKKTIPELVEKYAKDIPLAHNYYEVLVSDDTVSVEHNFEGLGNLQLYILIQKEFRRKVLMARSNGMKIFDQDRISATIQFAGVCILKDENLNAYFREMENPEHDSWEPDRHSNKREAKKMKQALSRFIKNKVLEVGRETITDEMDAVGAGEFIPDVDETSAMDESKIESIVDEVSEFTVEKVENIRNDAGTKVGEDSEGTFTDHAQSDGEEGGSPSENEREESSAGGSGSDYSGESKRVPTVDLLKQRLFVFDSKEGIYKLVFSPRTSAKNAYINVFLSGEQSKDRAEVSMAYDSDGALKLSRGRIRIGDIERGKSKSIFFSLDQDECYSMEVVVHGNKI